MHAGFPCFTRDLKDVLALGLREARATGPLDGVGPSLDRVGGTLLARGMATLLELGFGFLLRRGIFDPDQTAQAEAFFRDTFEIRDPTAPGGVRYYQGRFLIRTRKPEDDMNVYLRFCPDRSKLFEIRDGSPVLDPEAVIETRVLSEREAEAIEHDPHQVDLVILFKDVQSILGLVGRPDVDMVGLLLENVVRMRGNVGHLFKLGAVAKNIQLALGR